MTLTERIEEIIKRSGVTRAEFERNACIPRDKLVNGIKSGSDRYSSDVLIQILKYCPNVNPAWLLLEEGVIEKCYHVGGENPFDIYSFVDSPDVWILLGQVGCPACAGNLDAFQGFGIKKVMFCGGGGVLDRNIKVGEFLVVEGAIRDEGFSYHYLPAGRVVYNDKKVVNVMNEPEGIARQRIELTRQIKVMKDAQKVIKRDPDLMNVMRIKIDDADIAEYEKGYFHGNGIFFWNNSNEFYKGEYVNNYKKYNRR